MEDGPRYLIVQVDHNPERAQQDLQAKLRPGDRIVSIWPYTPHSGTMHYWPKLCALLELRHPSWAAEGVGWVCGEAPTL